MHAIRAQSTSISLSLYLAYIYKDIDELTDKYAMKFHPDAFRR